MGQINIHIKKVSSKLILIFVLVLILSACNAPVGRSTQIPTTEPPQIEENGLADSPIPPADTPTPTPSPPATPLPTLTSTPSPYALITGNTNCRTGPGSVYDLLHTYLAGDEALLLGKSPDGFFWYTSDQDQINPDCWLWGQYATPVGDTALLPVFTPPPTPTPSPGYRISYHRADIDAGIWRFCFKAENTGSVVWESFIIYIYDPIAGEGAGFFSNYFWIFYKPGVYVSSNIPAGEDGYIEVGGMPDPYANPGGGKIEVYVVICENDDLGGLCQGKKFTIDA
jgi:hypothetical protein